MKIINFYLNISILILLVHAIVGCMGQTDSRTFENNNQPTNTSNTQIKTLLEKSKKEIYSLIPNGYVLFDKIQGDLNEDEVDDIVLMIKGTNKDNIVINRFDKKVDRNRRGLIILFNNNDKYEPALENHYCFSSENEDGGVYIPPELSLEVKKGNLYINYNHGRYGSWYYTFRFMNSDFELIGYDSSDNFGPIINSITSINYLTKRKLERVNVNKDAAASGEEVFEDIWEDIEFSQTIKLSEVKDFDELVLP